jgi:hypothetical protein
MKEKITFDNNIWSFRRGKRLIMIRERTLNNTIDKLLCFGTNDMNYEAIYSQLENKFIFEKWNKTQKEKYLKMLQDSLKEVKPDYKPLIEQCLGLRQPEIIYKEGKVTYNYIPEEVKE